MHYISQIYFVMKLYMFRTVRLSIIRSLFTVDLAMIYVVQGCRQLSSKTRMVLLESCLQTCGYVDFLLARSGSWPR